MRHGGTELYAQGSWRPAVRQPCLQGPLRLEAGHPPARQAHALMARPLYSGAAHPTVHAPPHLVPRSVKAQLRGREGVVQTGPITCSKPLALGICPVLPCPDAAPCKHGTAVPPTPGCRLTTRLAPSCGHALSLDAPLDHASTSLVPSSKLRGATPRGMLPHAPSAPRAPHIRQKKSVEACSHRRYLRWIELPSRVLHRPRAD